MTLLFTEDEGYYKIRLGDKNSEMVRDGTGEGRTEKVGVGREPSRNSIGDSGGGCRWQW